MIVDKAPSTPDTMCMALRRPPPVSDQLRDAIRNADVSMYRISQETGVDKSVLSKFVAGHRNMSLESVDLVAEFLGLELKPRQPKRR